MTPFIPTASLPGGDIPLLGLGTWQSEGDDCYRAVRHALDVGYRHIDTATVYGNQEPVGRALADSGIPREDVFVTTKLPWRAEGNERATIEESLRLLGTEYVDLWLIHWPPYGVASPWIWEQFVKARNDGLARSIGVSNYSAELVDILSEQVGETPALDQIPWCPADYDPTVAHELGRRGVALGGYSPFKRSDLDSPTLVEVAAKYEVSPRQVVLRWHLEHGFVVIPKSAAPERIEANRTLDFRLTPDDIAQIDSLAS